MNQPPKMSQKTINDRVLLFLMNNELNLRTSNVNISAWATLKKLEITQQSQNVMPGTVKQ